jgi:hypothetical protein
MSASALSAPPQEIDESGLFGSRVKPPFMLTVPAKKSIALTGKMPPDKRFEAAHG